MSRTENSLRNIKFAIVFETLSIVAAFFTRRVFVATLTKEYLGLDGIFGNILTMLSLADLGIGSAITYSLYKPLAEKDQGQLAAIMALYKRVYHGIGFIVAALGCSLAPFLPKIIRDLPDIPHITLIYLLFVFNTSLSYFFVYKQSLILADQRQYVKTACHLGLKMFLFIAQALFLWLTHEYFIYLGLQIATTLLENILLSVYVNQKYPYIISASTEKVKRKTREKIFRDTKATLAHKFGAVIVFGTDNILIAYFVGAVAVGLYSNYLMVTNGLNSIYSQLLGSLTASVGNLGAIADEAKALPVFKRINFAASWLYGFSTVCLIVLYNPFISLWVGQDYLFSQKIICIIALNFYVSGMCQPSLVFRDAYGLYWHDRYKPIAESTINIVVSIALAAPFGVAGILVGTFISTMATCFWVEPLVVFRYGLHTSPRPYFCDYVINSLITVVTTVVVWIICEALPGTGLTLFVEKMGICAVLGNLGFLIAYHRREEFRYFLALLTRQLKQCK